MTNNQIEGLVLKNYSGFYYVQDSRSIIYECKLRGKLKEKILSGDRVMFTRLDTDRGILEGVLPRKNEMYRPKVANVNMVLIVMAYERPNPSLMLLDRLLVLAEYSGLVPCIILNKCDLQGNSDINSIEKYYPDHFHLIKTSAKNHIGIEELRDKIKGEIAVFAGPSGAGKSSLLNELTTVEDVRTQEVSNKIGRGKHTTRHVGLYPVEGGGWLVDTPGFSVLDMPPIKRERLPGLFPDFSIYADGCRFSNCLHYKENDCEVKNAVQQNTIIVSRYQDYITMLEEVMVNERCY